MKNNIVQNNNEQQNVLLFNEKLIWVKPDIMDLAINESLLIVGPGEDGPTGSGDPS